MSSTSRICGILIILHIGLFSIALGDCIQEKIFKIIEEVQSKAISPVNLVKMNAKTRSRYVKTNEKTRFIGYHSNNNLKSYESLISMGINPEFIRKTLSTLRPRDCDLRPSNCDQNIPFRTVTGICNNLDKSHWGQSYTQISRLFSPEYEDGFNSPKGPNLPNPRYISSIIHRDLIDPDPWITNMVPQFGQFIDHDLSLTVEDDLPCCSGHESPDCFPIQIFANDSFYSTRKTPQTCMPFTRSASYCFPTETGVREQMNILTSYLDASNVYGSTDEIAWGLRLFMGGRLRTEKNEGKFLPTVEEISAVLGRDIREEYKGRFVAGDTRVNEMPALAVVHTLFMREHNRIAREITRVSPYLGEEMVFQTARRIFIAEYQNIIFNEFLPLILSPDTLNRFELNLNDGYSEYRSNIDATIVHEFATAAYRFGHTLINGLIRLFRGSSGEWTEVGNYSLRDNFFIANQLIQNGGEGVDLILSGLQVQNSQKFDPHVTEDLGNFLFKEPQDDFGADLLARNIHRGRDHGIRGWATHRLLCELFVPESWQDRPNDIPPEVWDKLAGIYEKVEDIDLFTGGLVEIPVPGGVSGATFNCLKGMQFQKLKYGDRFFFTHGGQAGSFNEEQLRNLRGRRFGDIICENTNVPMTSFNVFRTNSEWNPILACNDTRRVPINIEIFV